MKTINKSEILHILESKKDEFFNKYNIKELALFGSYSRNEANENSDIDILVEIEPSFKNLYNFKKELENMFKRKVDVVTKKSLRSFIKDSIKEDIIYV